MKSMKSCKHATELMSLQHERKLNFAEHSWLTTHLALCAHCRRCKKQFDLLSKTCEERRNVLDSAQEGEPQHFEEETK
ncbi:hypothetical protein THMIRHAS_15730 [Thiosulfatimonas sediminis]|uniref:Putative zinc-finger domain-containing protein n=1 Tax=Thiosulfatimonas sediminis TaxID=2675054 RepID=A0A6F8PW50_9GAMM|nr:zf-HC2 domain-containing protein [Thiosulfatimonas sediminis]BBP46200.1 hypothetical protein THMIRHAS_15730 [Thiosulfatimonas sediminis]